MAKDPVLQTGFLSPDTYPNRFLAMIPPEAPFYRRSLKVETVDDKDKPVRQLIEGLDYRLGYYYLEASHKIGDDIFGGILLFDTSIRKVKYTFEQVGRMYQIPKSEIAKVLVSDDLESPLNVDWSALMRYVPDVPAVDPPKDLEEAIERDSIVAAINALATRIQSSAAALDASYNEVRNEMAVVASRIFLEELYQHHLNKNPHHYTADDIKALRRLAVAVDSTLIYGFNLKELTDIFITAGIQKKHLEQFFVRDEVLDLKGRLTVIADTFIEFINASKKSSFRMEGRKLTFKSSAGLTFTAGDGSKSTKAYVSFKAGFNQLLLSNDPDSKGIVYNGSYLVTGPDVQNTIHSGSQLDRRGYAESTPTLAALGNATKANPLSFTARPPTASTSVVGLSKITELSTHTGLGYGISQNALTVLKDEFDTYVPITFTINGQSFNANQEITIAAKEFGLDKVDNTSSADKPISTALKLALDSKAQKEHTHTQDDLTGKPDATDNVEGLMFFANGASDKSTHAAPASEGVRVNTLYNSYLEKINAIIPGWATLPPIADKRSVGNVSELISHQSDPNAHGELQQTQLRMSKLWLLSTVKRTPNKVADQLSTPLPPNDSTISLDDTHVYISKDDPMWLGSALWTDYKADLPILNVVLPIGDSMNIPVPVNFNGFRHAEGYDDTKLFVKITQQATSRLLGLIVVAVEHHGNVANVKVKWSDGEFLSSPPPNGQVVNYVPVGHAGEDILLTFEADPGVNFGVRYFYYDNENEPTFEDSENDTFNLFILGSTVGHPYNDAIPDMRLDYLILPQSGRVMDETGKVYGTRLADDGRMVSVKAADDNPLELTLIKY